MSILSLACLGNGYAFDHISYRKTSTCCPLHKVHVIVVVFVYLYVRTAFAWGADRSNSCGRGGCVLG